jgi:hypothetical protein
MLASTVQFSRCGRSRIVNPPPVHRCGCEQPASMRYDDDPVLPCHDAAPIKDRPASTWRDEESVARSLRTQQRAGPSEHLAHRVPLSEELYWRAFGDRTVQKSAFHP